MLRVLSPDYSSSSNIIVTCMLRTVGNRSKYKRGTVASIRRRLSSSMTESSVVVENTGLSSIFREVRSDAHDADGTTVDKLKGFVIHPHSSFRRFWDMLIAIAVIYICWEIPFTLAYESQLYSSDKSWSYLGYFLDVLFLLVSIKCFTLCQTLQSDTATARVRVSCYSPKDIFFTFRFFLFNDALCIHRISCSISELVSWNVDWS